MKIREVLDGVNNLALIMPEFQREYVWTKDQAKQLIVSLFCGYPTGSLLFWQAKSENIPEIKNDAVDRSKLGSVNVILDGQQRITTLYLLMVGQIPPYYTESDITYDPRDLYFNLETSDFQYYLKSLMDNNSAWQRVVDCFDIERVNAVKIAKEICKNRRSEDFERVIEIVNENLNKLRQIGSIDYPIQSVPSDAKIDDAIEVFDRVNSKGTKLTDAELVLTHITGKWAHARRVLKEKLDEMSDQGFSFNLDHLTRFIVVSLTGSALFKKNAKLDFDLFDEKFYKESWEKVDKALNYIIPILKQDGMITSSNDMNTLNVIVPMVGYLLKNDIRFSNEMRYGFLYWMYLALIWERYSGQTDQRLDKDVHIATHAQSPIDELVNEIEDQRGRIEVRPSDLEGRGASHSLYRMLYIVTKWNKAVDWSNGSKLSDTIGDHFSIHSHHIFPQSLLYENGYSPENHIDKKKVNEIANRAFVTQDTNYVISNSSPQEYLPGILEAYPDALKKHLIPEDRDLWEIEHYELFLEKRRNLIAGRINEFLEMLKSSAKHEVDDKVDTDWLELISQGESNFVEFKSSIRWDYQRSAVNKGLEYVIAKTIAAFMNTEGGKLVIGVDDDGNILGLDYDYSTLSKANKDGFLLQMDKIINNYLGNEFHEYLNVTVTLLNGKEICVVEILDSSQPVFVRRDDEEEFYIRASASSLPLSTREANNYISSHWQ